MQGERGSDKGCDNRGSDIMSMYEGFADDVIGSRSSTPLPVTSLPQERKGRREKKDRKFDESDDVRRGSRDKGRRSSESRDALCEVFSRPLSDMVGTPGLTD